MNELKKKGLNSLNERISRLETEKDIPEEDDQLSKLVFRLKNKEQENKKKTMTSILDHFEGDLRQSVMVYECNIIKIIIFCIRYVEENHLKLSTYLNVKSCSEFKHELCKSFVLHVCKEYSEEMLDLGITNLCLEIYPNVKILEEILPESTESKKKKSFFSKK